MNVRDTNSNLLGTAPDRDHNKMELKVRLPNSRLERRYSFGEFGCFETKETEWCIVVKDLEDAQFIPGFVPT